MAEDKQGSLAAGDGVGGGVQPRDCCECIVLQSLYGSDELAAHLLHTDVETSFAFKQMVVSTSRQFHFDQRLNGRNVLPWANNRLFCPL